MIIILPAGRGLARLAARPARAFPAAGRRRIMAGDDSDVVQITPVAVPRGTKQAAFLRAWAFLCAPGPTRSPH
jgi:hypothetical protein